MKLKDWGKVKALLRYSLPDVESFEDLTSEEREIVGSKTAFKRILAWARDEHVS